MSNKKTLKSNKKNSKRGKSRKGGFFGLFKDKHNSECDPNNLVNLESSNELHTEYQKCCPKTWYGRKNNSQYCKALDLKYKDVFNTQRKDANLSKQLMTQTFTTSSENNVVNMIDCDDPELYNDEESIAKYNAVCNCDKTRWNPFSKKRKNCGIIKKKLDYIKKSQQDAEVSRQQEQQRRQQEQDARNTREAERNRIEEEDRARRMGERQNYENIVRGERMEERKKREKFINDYMKRYPVNLYGYTREQLDRYPKEIIQNNRKKEEYVKQFMIKYNPNDYGYTYDELMMDADKVDRKVKEKDPEIQHKRYQESLDLYDIDKDVPFKKGYTKIVDPFDEEEEEETNYSSRLLHGGSKTRKQLKKGKQKRRKSRKH